MILPNETAQTIFQQYLRRNSRTGEIAETVEQSFERVASAIAAVDEQPLEFYDQLLPAMTKLLLVPNRPWWFAGGMHSACTAIEIQDSLVRGAGSIMGSLRDIAAIQQGGSGVGQFWGNIRPGGALISRSGGKATGVVGFLEAYNQMLGTIKQGGFLQGANQACLPDHHPEGPVFTEIKLDEGALDQYNTNLMVSGHLLDSAAKGNDFEFRHNFKPCDSMSAMEYLDKIAHAMWHNGGMGVQYADNIQGRNALPGTRLSSNPCGEFFLMDGESCCPSYINLAAISSDGHINWAMLATLARLSTHMNDNSVDANNYIPEVPKLETMAKLTRRFGTGPTGFADMLINLGVVYGSPESVDLAGLIMEFILFHSAKESVDLARMRGPFPAIERSIYARRIAQPKPIRAYESNWGRPRLDWNDLLTDMASYGLRGIGLTSCPPSSFGSQVFGTSGYGIEPVAFKRYQRTNTGDFYIAEESPYLVAAHEIAPKDHLLVMAAFQRFVTEGIAKTVNLPNDATVEDVKRLIFMGSNLGLSGFTVYRAGSRKKEICKEC